MKVSHLADELLADTGFLKDLHFNGVEVSRLLTCIFYRSSMCSNHVYQHETQFSVIYSLIESKSVS